MVRLTHFIENPFQIWTRESAARSSVFYCHLDYRAPTAFIREMPKGFCKKSQY